MSILQRALAIGGRKFGRTVREAPDPFRLGAMMAFPGTAGAVYGADQANHLQEAAHIDSANVGFEREIPLGQAGLVGGLGGALAGTLLSTGLSGGRAARAGIQAARAAMSRNPRFTKRGEVANPQFEEVIPYESIIRTAISQGEEATERMLRSRGYSEEAIRRIMREVKRDIYSTDPSQRAVAAVFGS